MGSTLWSGSETQRYAAVLTSMVVGASLGLVAGAALGSAGGGFSGAICFAGFGFSAGLMGGCVAASLFAWLLKPRETTELEADYDDGPPQTPPAD